MLRCDDLKKMNIIPQSKDNIFLVIWINVMNCPGTVPTGIKTGLDTTDQFCKTTIKKSDESYIYFLFVHL